MKKSLLKLVSISLLTLLFSVGFFSQIVLADEASDKVLDDFKTPSPSEYCIHPENDKKNIAVVLEESLVSTPPESLKDEIRYCYRVTECQRYFAPQLLNVVQAEEKPKYAWQTVCVSNLYKDKPGDCSGNGNIKELDKLSEKKKAYYCQPVQVLLSKNGAGLLQVYIGTIYRWAAGLVGIITVLMMIINGIIISASLGDQQAVTNAKNRIMQSLIALVLLFLSALILYTVNPNFFTTG